MTVAPDFLPVLKKQRLSGVPRTIDLRTRQAADDTLSDQEFLYRVLHDEIERRESKQLDVRMRRANFEPIKTLEDSPISDSRRFSRGWPRSPSFASFDANAAGLQIVRSRKVPKTRGLLAR